MSTLDQRLDNEKRHAARILEGQERYWGWHTPAGRIRWQRRVDYLAEAPALSGSTLPGQAPRVLEIGCGTGTFSGALAGRLGPLVAVDIAHDLLAHARQRHPAVVFCQADIHNLAFRDNAFDAVIGCSVLHHLDIDLALGSLLRVLKPGGILRFSEPNLLNPQIYLQKTVPYLKRLAGDSPDEYAFTPGGIRRRLERAGCCRVTVRPYEFLHPHTPERFIDLVVRLEAALDKTPIGRIAGSLLIEAFKADRA